MNPEKRIAQARVMMLFDLPFWGTLTMFLEAVERRDLPVKTMATDGTYLFYDPDFVNSLTLQEVAGCIAHEVGHVAFLHLPRRQKRNAAKWNEAADYAVNALIRQERALLLPKGHLFNPDFNDKTVEWIYNQLPDPPEGSKGATWDSHVEWDNWGKGGQGQDQKNPLVPETAEQVWRERVAQAANSARMKGKLPGHLDSLVEAALYPKLDWKVLLRDMVTSTAKNDFRIIPPNKKHLWRGIYLPSTFGDELNIAVAIDSSGSMSDDEIKNCLTELKGICDTYENYTIYLFVCDTRIHQQMELGPYDPIPKTVLGRGGTSFIEPLEAAKKLDITAFVYMTDLCGEFPEKEPNFPVIWLCNNDTADAPWGNIIRLPQTNGGRR